ncbi:hypothetical protein AB0C34_19730 [Nocardia sp. NPDC049220]|uniref:hypothetical protein n=1 Tax=Nocardia sp. NPDC049220 TaxID=3155273 RepID=UPI0033D99C63
MGARSIFFDCLVLTVGVEHDDRSLAGSAVRVVKHLAAATDAACLVIDGFPRLVAPADRIVSPVDTVDVSSELADTLDMLSEFAERLEERGERVHLMPFGWNTSCRADGIPTVAPTQWARSGDDLSPDHPSSARVRISLSQILTGGDAHVHTTRHAPAEEAGFTS